MIKNLLLLFTLTMTACNAIANDNNDAPEVTRSWARATPPGATTSAIYMTIGNHSDTAIKLLEVKSSISERVEIHNTTMKDGMMQMRQINGIDIEKMSTVELKPHGMHVMLLNLNAPLKEGTAITIELVFSDGKTVSSEVPVMKQATTLHSDMKSDKHKDH